jgi:phosphatidylserine synthase
MIGILTAALPLIYWQSGAVAQIMLLPAFWYGYIIMVSYLMVMKTPMLALKGLSNKRKLVIPLLLVGIEIALTAFFYKWLAIPFGFMGYCLVSLLYKKTIIQ